MDLLVNYGIRASSISASPFYNLTIPSAYIDATLTNFPMTVRLTSSNFDFSLSNDSSNIYFKDTAGNILDHEVEYYSTSNSLAIYHVRIPSISSSANTVFELHTDGSGYTNGNNPTDVWDANYVMVHHLGSSTIDSTGNNYNLTQTGNVPTAIGALGPERTYSNTTANYLQTANITARTTWTASIIFKQGGTFVNNQIQTLYYKDEWSPGTWMDSDQIRPHASTSSTGVYKDYTKSFNDSTNYYHWTETHTGGNLNAFINAVTPSLIQQSSWNVRVSVTSPIYIGVYKKASTLYPWWGSLKEFRLSDIVRSNAWIKAEYEFLINNRLTVNRVSATTLPVNTNGLLFYVDPSFSESYSGSGTTVNDISGNNYTGTLINGASYSANNGGVFNFNGSSHRIEFDYDYLGKIGNRSHTASAWVKSEDVNGSEDFIGTGAATTGSILLMIFQGRLRGHVWDSSGNARDIDSNISVSNNFWYYMTQRVNWATGVIDIFINGNLVGSRSSIGTPATTISVPRLIIGYRQGTGTGSAHFDGQIGQVDIYDRALSNSEIVANFNATKTRFGL